MLDILPHELVLQVLASLDPFELRPLKLLSHAWLAFFAQYSETIYKSAAILRGYAERGVELKYSAQATGWLDDVDMWEELCRRHWTVKRAWKGRWLPPAHRRLISTGLRARSFSIVLDGRLVLVAQEGYDGQEVATIRTVDISTDTVIWRLTDVVRHVVGIRYDAGFLVLERERNSGLFEVWRREDATLLLPTVPTQYAPDGAMMLVHAGAWRSHPSSTRGAFIPHALLRLPDAVSSVDMARRHLFLLSRHAMHVYAYDVASTELVHTFDCHPNDTQSGKLCAVDIDLALPYPLLITPIGRTIFASAPLGCGIGEARALLTFPPWPMYRTQSVAPPHELRGQSVYRMQAFKLEAMPVPGNSPSVRDAGSEIFQLRVSRAGGHLAMITKLGTLVVARGDLRPQDAGSPPQVRTVSLEVAPHFLCLEDHRIAIGTSQGIFVTDVDFSALILLTSHPKYPRVTVELGLTKEALWVIDTTWSLVRGRHRGDDRYPVMVHYFSFSDLQNEGSPEESLPSPQPQLLNRLSSAILDALGS